MIMTQFKMYRRIGIVLVLFFVALLAAADGTAGQSATYLRYGASARSLAMGRAIGTIATGGDALFYNPAGLGILERWQFDFMHSQLWLDSRVNYASFTIPVKNVGGFGLGYVNMGSTAIDGRDEYNRPTGDFSSMESSILFGYGKWFWGKRIRAGLVAKYTMLQMDDQTAGGLGGFDVGIVSKSLMSRKARLGLTVQNIGAGEIAGDSAPMTVRAGGSYRITRDLIVTAEGVMVMDGPITPHVGAEYKLGKMVSLRAGYAGNEVTFGLGLAIDRLIGSNIANTYQSLDYAGSAMNPIDNNFLRFSLTIRGQEMTNFWELVQRLEAEGSLCENQTEIETFLEKDGAVGAKANIIIGECLFNYESVESPLSSQPRLDDINEYYNFAYQGLFGSEWMTAIATNEQVKQHNVFSQKTHYMYAETQMADGITPETKQLIHDLILTGGDSTQYDSRLQYDLAYVHEKLGEPDSAITLYKAIAKRDIDRPEKYLALYRLGVLLSDTGKDEALTYLQEIAEDYSYGFYNEEGGRISYPMYPKKFIDNSIVDEALLLKGEILFSQGNTEEALASFMDIVLFYPDLDNKIVTEAINKAAQCYEKLGDTESAASLRAKLGNV